MVSHSLERHIYDLAVVGGGAAGFMASISASDNGINNICVLEGTSKILEKVRISGGGRCNITNSVWDYKELVTNYPRGEKPLLSPFSSFSTLQAYNWFEERGLPLKIEDDGRVFPVSNSSSDVILCLKKCAIESGVCIFTKHPVSSIDILDENIYRINIKNKPSIFSKNVVLATGSSPSGRKMALSFGHKVIAPVPSLFTFRISNFNLLSCKGISLKDVNIKLTTTSNVYSNIGDILITHWGLSGPAILKLSAFGARSLYQDSYIAKLNINWINKTFDTAIKEINSFGETYPNKLLMNSRVFPKIPKRLWLEFLNSLKLPFNLRIGSISNVQKRTLVHLLVDSCFNITGKGPFGEEFVTAGGICLDEVHFKTMESKKLKGLYFAGEILNIDGITGGFNFQHCWTSGWIVGRSIAENKI